VSLLERFSSGIHQRRVHVVKCCGRKKSNCSKFARVKNGSTTAMTKLNMGVNTLGTQMSKANPVTNYMNYMEADNENRLEITSPSSTSTEVGSIFQFTFTSYYACSHY
jgi:hypothetical protein